MTLDFVGGAASLSGHGLRGLFVAVGPVVPESDDLVGGDLDAWAVGSRLALPDDVAVVVAVGVGAASVGASLRSVR